MYTLKKWPLGPALAAVLVWLPGCVDRAGSSDAGPSPDTVAVPADARVDLDGDADPGPGPCVGDFADNTVGLQVHAQTVAPGYTLFAPLPSNTTYLIDSCGRLVRQWTSLYSPACAVYLLPNGHLLRTARSAPASSARFDDSGCAGGRLEEYDWDGNLVWSFDHAASGYRPHHDVEALPNGNVILVVWEVKTLSQAIEAGRDPALIALGEVWADSLIEIAPRPGGGADIVWEWHVWDHLVQDFDPSRAGFGDPAAHPERIDLNFAKHPRPDWNHINAVAYDAALDQLVLTVRNFDEVWVIDHSTSSAEAAGSSGGQSGRGGDLLYRWGNPASYGAGGAADRQLFSPHAGHWIGAGLPGAGHLLIFNNGIDRPGGEYSSIEEILPPLAADSSYTLITGEAFEPAAPTWQYLAPDPTDLFAKSLSGAQRLGNGHTLICDGVHGTLFEVDAAGTVVWRYLSPVSQAGIVAQGDSVPSVSDGLTNRIFRAHRYAPEYPGLSGRDLTPGEPIEAQALP